MNMYDEGGADLAVSLIGLVQSVNENHGREHVMQLGQWEHAIVVAVKHFETNYNIVVNIALAVCFSTSLFRAT